MTNPIHHSHHHHHSRHIEPTPQLNNQKEFTLKNVDADRAMITILNSIHGRAEEGRISNYYDFAWDVKRNGMQGYKPDDLMSLLTGIKNLMSKHIDMLSAIDIKSVGPPYQQERFSIALNIFKNLRDEMNAVISDVKNNHLDTARIKLGLCFDKIGDGSFLLMVTEDFVTHSPP